MVVPIDEVKQINQHLLFLGPFGPQLLFAARNHHIELVFGGVGRTLVGLGEQIVEVDLFIDCEVLQIAHLFPNKYYKTEKRLHFSIH